MGKVEKIVVLSVLFLIAVILAVSLDSGGKDEALARGRSAQDEGPTHLGGDATLEGGADAAAAAARESRLSAPLDIPHDAQEPASRTTTGSGEVPQAPAREEDSRRLASGGLLNAAVSPGGTRRALNSEPLAPVEPRRSETEALAFGDLVTTAGLEDTLSVELMAYTCEDGDTFKKAAARFYGDASKAELLRRYNEGVRELSAGHVLFVPIHDDGYGAVEEYEVLEGESLWVVAKKVYGKGHLWNEIWEANKDRLKSPDAVRAGVVLRIP